MAHITMENIKDKVMWPQNSWRIKKMILKGKCTEKKSQQLKKKKKERENILK